jgi:hypothetical protein
MERRPPSDRRAQRASEPDWSSGLDSTTELPEYSDAEFGHLDEEVVQQMEEAFGPDPEPAQAPAAKPDEDSPEEDDSSVLNEGKILLSRAKTQVAEAVRSVREARQDQSESRPG